MNPLSFYLMLQHEMVIELFLSINEPYRAKLGLIKYAPTLLEAEAKT